MKFILSLLIPLFIAFPALAKDLHVCGDVSVYFSPRGGATTAVVQAIDATTTSALVQAYSFTSAPISAALIRAHARGVDVRIVLDRGQIGERSQADECEAAGIPVLFDRKHAIAHNKVMVLDGKTVITGSFNFTGGAEERNAENMLVIHDEGLAAEYAASWHEHAGHSVGR